MRDARHTPAAMLLVSLTAFLIGCSSDRPPTDLVRHGTVHVETVPSQTVQLSPPRVTLKAGITTIAGEVQLAPGGTAQPAGAHVQIDALDASGREVDRMRVGWTPETVSANAPSHYRLSSLWTPQPGTVLRLTIVDDDATTDDTMFASSSGGGTGGGKSMPSGDPGGGHAAPAPRATGINTAGGVPAIKGPRSPHGPSLPGHSHR